MDYQKIDAALAAALEDLSDSDGPRLGVFVHLAPNLPKAERDRLRRLGLPASSSRSSIVTATLSPTQVGKLSQQEAVRQLRLSTPLRLLGDER